MSALWISLLLMMCSPRAGAQDILVDKQSQLSFFSKAPLEDISAKTSSVSSALNIKSNEIAFKVAIKSFKFKKRLMQTHFNENYMESDKYSHATFAGEIKEAMDWSRDGQYLVTVTGNLDIHGVKKFYTTKATVAVKNGKISTHAKFNVRVADHNIKIPRVVIKNIAEVVEVEVFSTYQLQ